MKKNAVFAILLVLTLLLTACGGSDKAKTITTADLNKALESYEITVDFVADGDKVSQFTITASGVNADDLINRDYVKEAYDLIMNDPGKSTFGHYKVLTGFGPVMGGLGLIDTTKDGEFSESAFIDEVLDIVCDGKAHTEAGWAITAKVDIENDTITITGISE